MAMDSPCDTAEAVGFPIRTSSDQCLLPTPQGFSQGATSFIASTRQGIHQMPFAYLSATMHRDKPTYGGPDKKPEYSSCTALKLFRKDTSTPYRRRQMPAATGLLVLHRTAASSKSEDAAAIPSQRCQRSSSRLEAVSSQPSALSQNSSSDLPASPATVF